MRVMTQVQWAWKDRIKGVAQGVRENWVGQLSEFTLDFLFDLFVPECLVCFSFHKPFSPPHLT